MPISANAEPAYFAPKPDYIQMPEKERFLGSDTTTATAAYYSTLLHELTHWIGVDRRCDRNMGKRFGGDR